MLWDRNELYANRASNIETMQARTIVFSQIRFLGARWMGTKTKKKKTWVDSDFVLRRNDYEDQLKKIRTEFKKDVEKEKKAKLEKQEERKQMLQGVRDSREKRRR